MTSFLFTYGSLILESCPVRVTPIESVFIIGYKLALKQKENSSYSFLIAYPTKSVLDIIAGSLAEVTEEHLLKIDKYEGPQYERVEVDVYKRNKEVIAAFMYKEKAR